jgi:hypothetical protein
LGVGTASALLYHFSTHTIKSHIHTGTSAALRHGLVSRLAPKVKEDMQIPPINLIQSRILAGTNLRMIVSRMEYSWRYAGEESSATESRDIAGMVT